MEGKYVTDARVGTDPYTGEFNVSMNMNSEGAKRWANVTRENVNQSIAIVWTDWFILLPMCRRRSRGKLLDLRGFFPGRC